VLARVVVGLIGLMVGVVLLGLIVSYAWAAMW